MDCNQLTKASVALEIIQTPQDRRLPQLFNCIYKLFQVGFLSWISQKYSCRLKDKLLADAKDAFQNGLMTFYLKAQKQDFTIKGSLKTTIYSFGLLQLLAHFKKERTVYSDHDFPDFFIEDEVLANERQQLFNEQEQGLLEALAQLPEKQRSILSMRFFKHMKSKQIAEKLNVSAGYVDNESAKAYKALRNILKPKLNARWN